ncbi:MAG: 16S rRNA (cytosine(967)-C(5))-methyltransferase RsmB [Clostridia bacterium]|nr:16S rRNA (cytosine(967)-C(5))-methyltransferase RsmB [Clostridia bacterium]
MLNAREVALRALISYRRESAWPDLYLKKACADLRAEEAALASNLTYGVLQNRAYLDFLLSRFSARPLEKITPQVLDALRLGAYQLVFLTRIPHSAAVNESVELVKKHANAGAAGYANGVLRALQRSLDALPEVPREDELEYLSVRYSHPKWFAGKMRKRLGFDGCEALLRANNAPAPVTARVNTLKTTREALLARFAEKEISANPHPHLANAIIFETMKGVLQDESLRQGLFYIQDVASQLCVEALGPRPGDTVFDLCAAPGGKSMLAAQMMEDRGSLLSMDIHPHKSDLIAQNAGTYGITCLDTVPSDASVYREALAGRADAIVCDVPCSGMGVIRKKPDVRYKDGDHIKVLPPLQLAILENAGKYLKPGGRLVYSTCTVLREENEAVVERFLTDHPDFALEPFDLPGIGRVEEGMLTLWPHVHGTDGFFMAKIVKVRG